MVAVGGALVGSARLALAIDTCSATGLDPHAFWAEVRRTGASVVFYAGEMCRPLVAGPPLPAERNHPLRLLAGSGMRSDLWKRLVDRLGPIAIREFYATTEANVVLANIEGTPGSLGRPLPGSAELAIAAYDFDVDDFVRDGGGRLVRARIDQPGMLIVRLDGARGTADLAHLAPTRILRDAMGPGDTWFVTGDLLAIDGAGDYWYVDRQGDTIRTASGPVPSRKIEDALHEVAELRTCVAVGVPGLGDKEQPAAAIALVAGAELDLAAVARAVVTLPPTPARSASAWSTTSP